MPNIYDNMELSLLPALQRTLAVSQRADFGVGYFNLRGWQHLDEGVERWTSDDTSCCRLMVGMQSLPQDDLREVMRVARNGADDHEGRRCGCISKVEEAGG